MRHWFWLLLCAACLAWYGTITILVGWRGLRDIREMLRKLDGERSERSERR